MDIEIREASQIFPKVSGKPGKLRLPYGVYDDTDPEDERLIGLIPADDPNYLFPGPTLLTLLVILQERHNVLLYGGTGVGKSMIAMMLGHHLNLPVTRINFQGDMGSPEVFGYYGLPDPTKEDDDGWKWTALVRGIQRPGIVLLDEWDAIRPEVGIGLQRVLEDHDPGIFLTERDEFIPRHPDCTIIATANTKGLGDSTGLFNGTNVQNFAQLNRFHVILEMDPLPADRMEIILKKVKFNNTPLKPDFVDTLMKFYKGALAAYKTGDLTTALSVRTVLHFARYFNLVGYTALELVVLSKVAQEEDRLALEGIADRVGLVDPKKNS